MRLSALHPDLLGDVYERIILIPEDDEVMDILEHQPGFNILNYAIEDE